MTLVTRVSVAFLVALALSLTAFSACLYYVSGLRLRLALDQELEATLDRFPERPEGQIGRVSWAIYDESGHRVESTPAAGRTMVLDGRGLGPLAIDIATTIKGPDGLRWRVLARKIGGGRPLRGPRDAAGKEHRPGPPLRDERKGSPGRDRPTRVLAAWAFLEPVEREIGWLAVALPLLSLCLWMLAAVIGRHFARRALSPLTVLAESARDMPFDDGRLPSPGTGDELEHFARSFNGLLDRLYEALERQRQFTGQASHQLRTPLSALIAAIEVARRRTRTVPEHEQILDHLHVDASRLWQIVEALMFLARPDAEAGLSDLEPLDVNAWAAGHVRAWSGHARATDFRFEGTCGPASWARAHRPLLGQLLDNLLENACKHSMPGTPIVVRMETEPSAVIISVEDQGCGIAPADLERIFEPFYRAESTRRQGHAGVGLGLAVARRIAEAHGGTITAESALGHGSRLIVRLSRAPEPESAPVVSDSHEPAPVWAERAARLLHWRGEFEDLRPIVEDDEFGIREAP
jgi:signal transduction histidine kinase